MKIKWDDYVSNEQVLSRANIDDIEILLAKSRLRWLGHVSRMEDVRAAKMILFGELEHGLRSVGRPKLRFKDNCKQLLKRIDLLDWNVVAKNRSLWRSKIKAVCESLNVLRMERYQRKKEGRKR